jgi:hypothetical protein
MAFKQEDMLRIHVNISISASALQTIVANAKKLAVRDPNGTYRVDTSERVGEIITRFLAEKNFEGFAGDLDNYGPASDAAGRTGNHE